MPKSALDGRRKDEMLRTVARRAQVKRWWTFGFLLLAILLSGCLPSSPSYGDLEVGECVSGDPQTEGAYERVDCAQANVDTEPVYEVVDKARDPEGTYSCPLFSLGITDGEWTLCFDIAS